VKIDMKNDCEDDCTSMQLMNISLNYLIDDCSVN
jgi:hypothetical protein